jgi:hypothetical protein
MQRDSGVSIPAKLESAESKTETPVQHAAAGISARGFGPDFQ